jgi:ADP-heptose:LPS heptosyltransferase
MHLPMSRLAEIRAVAKHGRRHPTYLCASFLANLVKIAWIVLVARVKRGKAKIVGVSLLEHFGDIVACEPVARYLKQTHSNAFIVWFVRKPYRELLDHNPHIDKVVTLSCLTEWIWLSRFNWFDLVTDLHMEGRVCQRCAIPLHKRTGNTEITRENYYHIGGLLSAFSKSAGLPELTDAPQVYIPESVRQTINGKGLPQHFVTFHCESIEKARDWSVEKWRELAEKTTSTCGVTVVEVGTKSVLSQWGLNSYVNLCGQLELLETAEVIKRSALFVGIDSGPAQFANALDVRGVILLGHYQNFKRYLPYSGNYASPNKAEIVYGDGPAASLEVERVFGAVERQLRLAADFSYLRVA